MLGGGKIPARCLAPGEWRDQVLGRRRLLRGHFPKIGNRTNEPRYLWMTANRDSEGVERSHGEIEIVLDISSLANDPLFGGRLSFEEVQDKRNPDRNLSSTPNQSLVLNTSPGTGGARALAHEN